MVWKPDYTTSTALKNYLRIDDTADDTFIAAWITAVSRNIDDHCGRQFGQVASAQERYFTPSWDRWERKWIAEIHDLQDTTGLVVSRGDDTLSASDYELWPRNAASDGVPYTRIRVARRGELTMEGLWGWTAVPKSVEVGVWLQAARLAARRDSPFGVAGSPTEGSEIRLLAQLDPDFKTTLKPFVRKWWAA